jgi:hypothetical protein
MLIGKILVMAGANSHDDMEFFWEYWSFGYFCIKITCDGVQIPKWSKMKSERAKETSYKTRRKNMNSDANLRLPLFPAIHLGGQLWPDIIRLFPPLLCSAYSIWLFGTGQPSKANYLRPHDSSVRRRIGKSKLYELLLVKEIKMLGVVTTVFTCWNINWKHDKRGGK